AADPGSYRFTPDRHKLKAASDFTLAPTEPQFPKPVVTFENKIPTAGGLRDETQPIPKSQLGLRLEHGAYHDHSGDADARVTRKRKTALFRVSRLVQVLVSFKRMVQNSEPFDGAAWR